MWEPILAFLEISSTALQGTPEFISKGNMACLPRVTFDTAPIGTPSSLLSDHVNGRWGFWRGVRVVPGDNATTSRLYSDHINLWFFKHNCSLKEVGRGSLLFRISCSLQGSLFVIITPKFCFFFVCFSYSLQLEKYCTVLFDNWCIKKKLLLLSNQSLDPLQGLSIGKWK